MNHNLLDLSSRWIIDLGASPVQYRGAELWNNWSQEQQSIPGVNQLKNRTKDTIIETY